MLFNRKRNRKKEIPAPEERPAIPLPADTFEDRAMTTLASQRQKAWIDEAFEEYRKNGGFDNLPGLGKPLHIPEGDVMQTILKNANVSHPWITLRNEIRDSIRLTADLLDVDPDNPLADEQLQDINRRIAEMNLQAPGMSLHRRKITRENIREQLEKWM